MIPKVVVEPVSENVIRVILSSGIVIEVSDGGDMIGGSICISENMEKLRLARFKKITVVPKGADEGGFRVEMQA